MPLPRPAPSCTRTACPAWIRAWTPAGTRLTRYSWSLISFGTPTCMLRIPRSADTRRTAPARAGRRRSVVVDLRLLKLAGIIHVDCLPLREDLDRGVRGPLAVPVAGALHSAERQVSLGPDGRGIDVRDAGLQIARRRERLVHVLSVNRGRQTVQRVVGDLQRGIQAVGREHADDRTEDLLARQTHGARHAGEDRRREEPAAAVLVFRQAHAAEHRIGSLVAPDLDVVHDLLELRLA